MSDNIEHRAFFGSAEVNATLKRMQNPYTVSISGGAKPVADVPRPIIKVPGRRLVIDSEGKVWTFTTEFTARGWKQLYLPCTICEPLAFHNNKYRTKSTADRLSELYSKGKRNPRLIYSTSVTDLRFCSGLDCNCHRNHRDGKCVKCNTANDA